MSGGRPWADLSARTLSGVVMAALSGVLLYVGGAAFNLFVAIVYGILLWELTLILAPDARRRALGLAVLGSICLAALVQWSGFANSDLIFGFEPGVFAFLPAIAGSVFAVGGLARRALFFGFAAMMCWAALVAIHINIHLGPSILLSVVFAVAASDVAGYFAGRALGGPRFWPAVSPKKTWAGIIAGWGAAGLIGPVCAWIFEANPLFAVLMFILISIASQVGDMAQSALKRYAGIKDSSNLIPGHGGVFDRLDGLLMALTVLYPIVVFWIIIFGYS